MGCIQTVHHPPAVPVWQCVCVCVYAFVCACVCIRVCPSSYIPVWLFLLGRFMISISLGCFVEIEMCCWRPGGISLRLKWQSFIVCVNVCGCISVHVLIFVFLAVKGQFLWDGRLRTHTCLLSSRLVWSLFLFASLFHTIRCTMMNKNVRAMLHTVTW